VTIASLIVDVAANTAKLQTDVEQIHGQFDKLGSMAAKMGAVIAGAFTFTAIAGAAKKVLDFADNLTNLAQKTGISTSGLQKLDLAFQQSGVGLDVVSRASNELGARLVSDKGAVALVKQLGMNLDELKKMTPEDRLLKVADAVGNIKDQGEQVYASKTLFGKGGVEMLQGLNGHLAETADKFKDLIIPPEAIAAADDFGDKMGVVGKQILAVIAQAIAPMLPALTTLIGLFGDMAAVLGPVLGRVLKDVTLSIMGLWQAFADLLSGLGDAAQKIPFVGKHLGFLTGATDWLKASSEATAAMMKKLETSTVSAGESAHKTTPHLLGLGDAAETSGRKVDFLKTQLGQMALAGVQVQMAYDSINKSMTEQGVHLPKLAVMHEDLATKTDVLSKSSAAYLQIHTLTNYEIRKAIHDTEEYGGAIDSLVSGFTSGLDNLWKGMSGGRGFAGLMHNLGDSIVGGFGNIISGGLTSVINMGVQIAVEGVKKIGSLIAGLFKSEESAKVNSPRDQFFAQFGGYDGLANDLTQSLIAQGVAEAGNVASGLIRTLNDADTAAKFKSAEMAISDVFKAGGREVKLFTGGTMGQFVNFGAGTNAVLHGRERIMTEAEGRRDSDMVAMFARFIREFPSVMQDTMKTAAVYSR
jgi:hypothetical protein